ncbi:helix-turn-helix domain-containing protein [Pseudoduganella sp. R-34]|uniref:helix-turn-helix domain-containing protein n=1 Tax=Pseudoduganella sp. R-34 TaxID=3404062 RepID=UPI003CEE1377
MDHNKAFGLVIRESRDRLGLSQEGLAFLVSLDRSYISLLERGKRSASLNTIVVLAHAFDLTPSELVRQHEAYTEPKKKKKS